MHNAILAHSGDIIELPIIAWEEIWDGWTTAIKRAKTDTDKGDAYDRLTMSMNEVRRWTVRSFHELAIARFTELKKLKLNVRANDMKIASIAL